MPHHFKCVPSSLFVLFCDEEDLLLGATPDQPHKGLVHCDGSVGGDGGEREPEDHLLVLVSCKPVLVGGRVTQSVEREGRRGGGRGGRGERMVERCIHRNAWVAHTTHLHVESISQNSSCTSSETAHTTRVRGQPSELDCVPPLLSPLVTCPPTATPPPPPPNLPHPTHCFPCERTPAPCPQCSVQQRRWSPTEPPPLAPQPHSGLVRWSPCQRWHWLEERWDGRKRGSGTPFQHI